MNKLWKTCKHARALIEMAFLCICLRVWRMARVKTVKQPEYGGTSLHNTSGITGFFSGKTPYCVRSFCERNENRMLIRVFTLYICEQRTGCPVLIVKTVIK
jgi:hypothetical protein